MLANRRRVSPPTGIAGEVPRGVLAEVAHRQILAEMARQEMSMAGHHGTGFAQRRRGRHRPSVEGLDQIAEQPRPAEAATTDDDAVATGLAHHRNCVGRLPDVAVAEHWDLRNGGLQLPDRVPIGRSGIVLLGGSGMQRDGYHALVDGDAARLDVGQQRIEEAFAELDRDRHASTASPRRPPREGSRAASWAWPAPPRLRPCG